MQIKICIFKESTIYYIFTDAKEVLEIGDPLSTYVIHLYFKIDDNLYFSDL